MRQNRNAPHTPSLVVRSVRSSTVDDNVAAVDVVSARRAEEHHGVLHLFGFGHHTLRNLNNLLREGIGILGPLDYIGQ